MARMKGKEAIVEGDEEIRRRKRVNNDNDTHPAKKANVEGNMAAELPILVGRNLGEKAEGEAAALCDGELNNLCISTGDKTKEEEEEDVLSDDELNKLRTHTDGNAERGDKTEEEEEEEEEEALSDDELNKLRTHTNGNAERGDEVNRLRGLLADGPKKLNGKDVEDVIRYLEVDDIVSLALNSGQGKGNDDGDTDEKWIDADESCVPSYGKVFVKLRLMLRRIENIGKDDFWRLYQNLPHQAFALLLLMALDSYSNRCGVPSLKVEDRDMIPKLCAVLPWKLFAHILYYKASLPLLKFTSEETHEVCTPAQKEAAESCKICLGKGKHRGRNGYFCSFLAFVPKGVTVGPNCWVVCRDCGTTNYNPVDDCVLCGSEVGKAVPIPSFMLAEQESDWKITSN